MELDNIIDQETEETPELQASAKTKNDWVALSGWTTFMSVLGFIFLGLMTIAMLIGGISGVYAMTRYANGVQMGGIILGFIFMLGILILFFYINYYQIQFATKIKRSVFYNDGEMVEVAFRNLRNFYRAAGITTIAVIAFYLIAIIFLVGSSGF